MACATGTIDRKKRLNDMESLVKGNGRDPGRELVELLAQIVDRELIFSCCREMCLFARHA
jgi:hypothetical protein